MRDRTAQLLRMVLACAVILGAPATRAQAPAPPAAAAAPAAVKSTAVPERRSTEFGFAVFQQKCVSCHGNPAYERAPSPAALRAMTPERIYTALTTGLMKAVGDTLTEEDRRRVSESLAGQFLGSADLGDAAKMANHCASNLPMHDAGSDWNGWGNGPANNRFQSAAAAGLTADSVPQLKLKWAFGFPGGTSAYGQPTVYAGRIFVGSDTGYIYSLDAATGCVYWSYRTQAGVRNAMTIGPLKTQTGVSLAVFFGDLKASVYAIDARTGAEIWKTRVDDHFATRVTAAPALYRGRLYVPISAWEGFQARVLDYPCCTAVGSVSALDATTGKLLWKTYSIAQRPRPTHKNSRGIQQWAPAGAPIWNTPTVDAKRRVVYVGTGDASTYPAPATSDAVLALDMRSGKVRWSRQIYRDDAFIVGCSGSGFTDNCPKVVGPDWDIPMSPMLKTAAGRSMLIFGTKPGEIQALDADQKGELLWRRDVVNDKPLSESFRPGSGNRGPLWGGALDDGLAYFGLGAGGVAAVQLTDGQRVWYTPLNSTQDKPVGHTAAATVMPGVVFVGGSDGRIWALATQDGHVLWSFETARAFTTVNGVAAHGGSIAAPGPTVAGGMLFMGSGYGIVSQMPGNVLLAFGVP